MVVQFVYVNTVHIPNRALYIGFLIAVVFDTAQAAAVPIEDRKTRIYKNSLGFLIAKLISGFYVLV